MHAWQQQQQPRHTRQQGSGTRQQPADADAVCASCCCLAQTRICSPACCAAPCPCCSCLRASHTPRLHVPVRRIHVQLLPPSPSPPPLPPFLPPSPSLLVPVFPLSPAGRRWGQFRSQSHEHLQPSWHWHNPCPHLRSRQQTQSCLRQERRDTQRAAQHRHHISTRSAGAHRQPCTAVLCCDVLPGCMCPALLLRLQAWEDAHMHPGKTQVLSRSQAPTATPSTQQWVDVAPSWCLATANTTVYGPHVLTHVVMP